MRQLGAKIGKMFQKSKKLEPVSAADVPEEEDELAPAKAGGASGEAPAEDPPDTAAPDVAAPEPGPMTVTTMPMLAEGYIDRLERLDRLDKLDARDRREAEEAKLMRQAKQQRVAALDAADARDAVALGAEVLTELIEKYGQGHLVAGWAADGRDDASKQRFFRQIKALHEASPGGLP
eukprot:2501007-Prymnesium_polylepis.1